MAGKRIIWSSRASSELKSILSYYNERNQSTIFSSKILDSVQETIELIAVNNYLGRLTSNKRTRVINLDVFLLFYEVSTNSIDILSFWDNRQNPKERITQ